jgi:hypothetical protein
MTTPNDTSTLRHQLVDLIKTAQQTHNEALRDLERLRIVQEANDGVVIGTLREIAYTQEANAHEVVSLMQKIAFRYGKLPVVPLTAANAQPAVEAPIENTHDPLPRVLQGRPAWPPQQPPRLNANGGVH